MPRLPHKFSVIAATFAGEGLFLQAQLILAEADKHFLKKILQQLWQ
jgi:hypothetical protein